MLIEVVPGSKSYKLDSFTYSVPHELEQRISIGSIVAIPFGKHKIRGCVTNITIDPPAVETDQSFAVKDIISVEPTFSIPTSYLGIIDWISQHYLSTLGEALSLFLPPEMKRPPKSSASREAEPKHNLAKLNNLSDSQEGIYSEILKAGSAKPHLIFGVTGSGKTEIYLHLCAEVLKQGKSIIILVPEIILTPQTVSRFEQVFGDSVVLLHSNLSQGEKYSAYRDFYQGAKKIIVGPRSALLVPNDNIGLIVVDEEHEDSYKQDNSPRYHAVELAERIAAASGALLVLGSATPRIESFYKTEAGEYILHQIKGRYNKLLLPPAETIDLRNELRSGNYSIISEKLALALEKILKKKKQAILFLNRRGASTFVSCRECGFVIKCPNCDIPMIHHSATGSYLYCHHCDLKQELPTVCPECHGVKIKYFGAGVEKVESEVNALFPTARVRRIDASTIKNKGDYETFYHDFKDRKFDIAIGTQMITKGLDLPHVDLVGIISADTGLHMPYFRASEKIFRLVTQVSGRSGRLENTGQTIIQTYWPDSTAIKFASDHDFEGFYRQEIENRKKHHYPPFCDLVRVVSEHEKPELAKAALLKLTQELDKLIHVHPDQIEYIGPGLCFFQRIRGRWRYHLIIKLRNQKTEKLDNRGGCHPESNGESSNSSIDSKLRELWRDNLNLIWDVNPNDLL